AAGRRAADSGRTAAAGRLPGMGERERPTTVALPAGICRRCVRALSRRISDVPGVLSLEYDAAAGVLRVGGEPDLAALRALGLPVTPASG
ncbi:heavy-metal-associated domain-containing protein, partial [Micromonospora sp. NPDC003776]